MMSTLMRLTPLKKHPLPGAACAATLLLIVALAACGGRQPATVDAFAQIDRSHEDIDARDDYRVEEVVSRVLPVTDVAPLPDGGALVSEKGGWQGAGVARILLFDENWKQRSVALRLSVCTDAERGLVAMALAPDFEKTGHLYVTWTPEAASCAVHPVPRNPSTRGVTARVSRFTMRGEAIERASESVILDELPAYTSSHFGGGMAFLPDGTMVVGLGDGGGAGARGRPGDLGSVSGKILRLDPDRVGIPPPDNPYVDARTDPSGPSALVWARGFRNPFRLVALPDGRVLAFDVGSMGSDAVEELNIATVGQNYGWGSVEGVADDPSLADPILWYRHSTGCGAIIGGALLAGVATDRADQLAFADFKCGKVWVGDFDGERVTRVRLVARLEAGISSIRAGRGGSIVVSGTGTGPEGFVTIIGRRG